MIQRVQTIWLIIAAAAVFATLKLPTLITGDLFNPFLPTDDFLLMVLTCALGTLIIVNIFLFKYRVIQFRICIVAMLVEAGIIALYFLQLKKFPSGAFGIWAVFHAIALIALILAARGVYKDEKLIKDSSRLR